MTTAPLKRHTFSAGSVSEQIRLKPGLEKLLPGLSSRQAMMALGNGLVRVNGEVATDFDLEVGPEDEIEIDLRHGVKGEGRPRKAPLLSRMKVLQDEPGFVVVAKSAGVVVQPTEEEKGGREPPLVELLKHYWKARKQPIVNPVLVHRLDRGTSGVMVLAKTLPAARTLQKQAASRLMERTYLAVVRGVPREAKGTWRSWLGINEHGFRCSVADSEEEAPRGAKEAVTHFRVMERGRGRSLLELRLETGRTHQIRIHCAEAGHPVIGDPVYWKIARGLREDPKKAGKRTPGRMMLHATRLKFRHPGRNTRWMTFVEPMPEEMGRALRGTDRPPKGHRGGGGGGSRGS